MALIYEKNSYTIPRGRVFFNPIDPATDEPLGEIYMGNCPGFTISIETEKAEHFSSETGLRQKDASVLLEVKRNGKQTCDNMSHRNRALFLSGTSGTITQTAGTVTGETLNVLPGRYYNLGLSAAAPTGVRMVSAVSVTNEAGTTTYTAGTDYVLDAQRAILQILGSGTIAAGKIKVGYTRAACTWPGIRTGSTGEINGAMRVASDNATGENSDYYMPRVSLVPSGDMPVIAEGTEFSSMEFDIDVLKPENGEAIYVDGVAVPIP